MPIIPPTFHCKRELSILARSGRPCKDSLDHTPNPSCQGENFHFASSIKSNLILWFFSLRANAFHIGFFWTSGFFLSLRQPSHIALSCMKRRQSRRLCRPLNPFVLLPFPDYTSARAARLGLLCTDHLASDSFEFLRICANHPFTACIGRFLPRL